MKKHIALFLAAAFFFVATISCTDDDVNPGGTATQKLAGDWYVQLLGEDGVDYTPYITDGKIKVTTYNTAANIPTEMFFDDGEAYPVKCKVKCDTGTLTFNTSDFVDNYYTSGDGTNYPVKIYEGKIIPNGGHAKSGRVTDSIYVKFEVEDDPGYLYIYAGQRRTGFLEDEY